MKNIKIVISSFILASAIALASANAMAKTQGNNASINLAYNKSSHKYARGNSNSNLYPEFDNSKIGFGLAYKYAVNYNNIFIAPGVFFDQIDTQAKDKDNDTASIKNRYGARLDIGYDLSEKIAVYGFGGLSSVNYEVNWKSLDSKISGRKVSPIMGAGLLFYPSSNTSVSLEYSLQQIDLKAPLDASGINNVKTDISSLKIGFGYQF